MKKQFILITLLTYTLLGFSQNINSPQEFLGYELGDNFTYHHKVVDYFNYLSSNNSQIQLNQYGETYEGRPLLYAVISSQENIDKLESIRKSNLNQTGLGNGDAINENIAIVWLSYNIHGNEAFSTEAAMKTAYGLLSNQMKSEEWLKNTIVIIDPCINPDGRDRYVHFYRQYGASPFNPNLDAVEHQEPWPGGRPNHYLFDLNRDWAWQTQKESKARMHAYHQWMPHIHVDFHEQYINSPYYFAPAAEPLHNAITDWQMEFQTQIGQNHAKYFDKENWLYFTRERFDLFYPSYGDTYPTFNGAIGMTYEQAGHGMAGLGGLTELGDTLTLKDRLTHHYTTGMSTIEIASENASRLNQEFKAYFDKNRQNPDLAYNAYVVKNNDGNEDNIKALQSFLDDQKIQYGKAVQRKKYDGYSYFERQNLNFYTTSEDIVIPVKQPKASLIQALFDQQPDYSDSLTYDITAWAIPYAYGLETYGVEKEVSFKSIDKQTIKNNLAESYAYIIDYKDFSNAKFLAALLQTDINCRVAYQELKFNGQEFSKGSIVITQRNNESIDNLNNLLSDLADQHQVKVSEIKTGFADQLYDIGSGEIHYVKPPKIAVLMGEGTSSLSYGQIWYYFEQALHYPITSIRVDDLNVDQLTEYSTLIMPSGNYSNLEEPTIKSLVEFAENGGKILTIGDAIDLFKEVDKVGLNAKEIDDKKSPLRDYKSEERRRLSSSIFGAIYEVNLDTSHPLAFGFEEDRYFSLKTSNNAYHYLEEGWNVGYINQNSAHIAGFAGYKAHSIQNESVVFGVENKGAGQIIYFVDDPLFRAFWYNGYLLMANAIFMVGND